MKAIRKSDGKEIDVILCHQKEYIAIEEDTEERGLLPGRAIYPADELIVQEPIDWDSFRREAAKDILVGLCANNHIGLCDSGVALVTSAIALVDELIEQIKGKSNE